MSWNPMDTVRDVRDFAYQNTGADNFMNIARGVRNGTMDYNPLHFGEADSFFGNLGAGALDAGLMFAPGARLGTMALKTGLKAGAGIGGATKSAMKASYLGPNKVRKDIFNNLKTGNFTNLAKNAGYSSAVNVAAQNTLGPVFAGGANALAKMFMPSAQAATPYSATSSNRSGSPAGTYKTTGVSPTMATPTQTTTDPYLGGNGVSDSYLDPATAASFNTTSGLYDSQFKTGRNKIQSDLLDVIQGIGRTTTGGTMDAMSQAADEGGWANSPQVETLGDYINQRGSQATSQARLGAANSLADLQMRTAQAKDANAQEKARAEWQARMDLFQRALASQPGIGVQ